MKNFTQEELERFEKEDELKEKVLSGEITLRRFVKEWQKLTP